MYLFSSYKVKSINLHRNVKLITIYLFVLHRIEKKTGKIKIIKQTRNSTDTILIIFITLFGR